MHVAYEALLMMYTWQRNETGKQIAVVQRKSTKYHRVRQHTILRQLSFKTNQDGKNDFKRHGYNTKDKNGWVELPLTKSYTWSIKRLNNLKLSASAPKHQNGSRKSGTSTCSDFTGCKCVTGKKKPFYLTCIIRN